MQTDKVIVVTGSTRGIGYGLAKTFLQQGCRVVVSGRSQSSVDAAMTRLNADLNIPSFSKQVLGIPCDVANFDQVEKLWKGCIEGFGRCDIWINNAGIANDQGLLWEISPEQVKAVINTNITGVINASIVAIRGMRAQGHGALYNMEGLGSDGRRVSGLALYGSTKSALRYLNRSLFAELKDSPVLVGSLSPGMVMTDMLMGQYKDQPEELEKVRKVFNILADRVETVAPWLAQRVLSNTRSGKNIAWLTGPKIMLRFLLAPFLKRDVFHVQES